MIDISSKDDIDKISNEILKYSKAYDVFPTPVDKILNYAELKIAGDIDLSNIDINLMSQLSGSLKSALEKIRGLLDRERKTIYLDLSQSHNRQNFVKLHEVGHDVLPWQKEILKYLDNDSTLDLNTKESFEAEANYFSSAVLFQQDRFFSEMKKLPLSINSSLHLAKQFGASVHATLRRYVEYTKSRCALLVLENITPNGTAPKCNVRNYFQSANFSNEFGEINWNKDLGYKWPFVKDYYFKRKHKTDGELVLLTKIGEINLHYHFFNNSYNAFVLLFPAGESKKSRIKFIIAE